mmetsp:Transcript_22891/g.50209  ORF Transcript_22891/g.50209 Transcript_22891/m.50209 type:complete len:226 (+) Transcript_22891:1425-2102(+)
MKKDSVTSSHATSCFTWRREMSRLMRLSTSLAGVKLPLWVRWSWSLSPSKLVVVHRLLLSECPGFSFSAGPKAVLQSSKNCTRSSDVSCVSNRSRSCPFRSSGARSSSGLRVRTRIDSLRLRASSIRFFQPRMGGNLEFSSASSNLIIFTMGLSKSSPRSTGALLRDFLKIILSDFLTVTTTSASMRHFILRIPCLRGFRGLWRCSPTTFAHHGQHPRWRLMPAA